MKKMELSQLEVVNGGAFDCSAEGQLAFIAGGATAGTLFGGAFGFLGGLMGSTIYSIYKCNPGLK
ncbi:MAG: hypothetical protein K2Q24_17085 [Chitinophagaceae bacterium]|nr:hypothetical protein [Chitinophagaceae bacterium]